MWHVCTREIQDDILQDKRATMLQHAVRTLIGIGSNEAADRSCLALYEAVDNTPAHVYHTVYHTVGVV